MPTTPNKNYSIPDKGTKNWHVDMNANFTAIDGHIDGFDGDKAEFNTETNLVAAGHNAVQPATAAGKISLEVKDMRGSLSTGAARLAVSINDDGTLKTATTSGDQWPVEAMTNPVYVSASSWKIDGDATGILQPGTTLKIDFNISGLVYLHVKSSSYAGGPDETTVTVWEDETVLNETIDSVAWGFVRPNDLGAAGSPGSNVRPFDDASRDIFYYNAASFNDPFNDTGGRIAKTNTGKIARVEYASGYEEGIAYTSVDDDADIASVVERLNTTVIETWTPTFDGTSGLITDYDRS
jgi:hypothetical protein